MQQFEVNAANIRDIFGAIRQFIRPNKRYLITVKEWEKRSLPANAQYYVWVNKISEFTGNDLKTAASMCKLDHGLPIALAGENANNVADILERYQFHRLSYDMQLRMIAGIEITRNFTQAEHNQYRNSIVHFWRNEGLMLDYGADVV